MFSKVTRNLIYQCLMLCKIRTCESTDYVTNLHAMNGRSVDNVVGDNRDDEVIEDNVFDFVKRKHPKDLSRSGREYRKAQLLRKLQEGDLQLLKSKGERLNAFETLNYQKDAHMSERDIMKTEKMFKRKVGANVLAGVGLERRQVMKQCLLEYRLMISKQQ